LAKEIERYKIPFDPFYAIMKKKNVAFQAKIFIADFYKKHRKLCMGRALYKKKREKIL